MGVVIPQVVTTDRASGAQVIDGSLKFDNSKTTNLSRTPGSEGNRKTWTWSGWFNRQNVGANDNIFKVAGSSNKATQFTIMIHNGNYVSIDYGGAFYLKTNRLLRDTSGWYNFVVTVDTTLGTADNRIRLYINGVEETSFATRNNPNQDEDLGVNRTSAHTISTGDSNGFDGLLSNFYLIDGQALGPGYFGYTDPLTNTWRPKKYTGSTNDTTYPNNINTNFSSSLSASSGFNASYPANNAFDGNLESFASSAGASQYLELSSSFTGVTSLRIQCAAGSGFDMEGETYTISGTGITSKDITTNSEAKSLTSISLTSTTISGIRVTSSSGLQARIVAIEINGIILKNNAGWGLNGFYLPMDGNSPIGQDKSGKGNDYTPVNFGGSVELDKATGARPILNTTQGGTQATVGVFGSRNNVGYAVTYYDDGGGNKYYIDGVKQATLTGLIRGATYTFNTVALGSTHPFRLSATSAHGTEYTNGVAAITGAATTITIPHDAPESLYYYCTAHSGMGSSITGITTNEKLADQYASHCVLALPLVGANSDASASIACTMTNKAVTSNGDAAASSDKSNFYAGSFEFDGTGDYLNLDIGSGGLGSGDFTIEFWSNSDTTSGQRGQFQLSPTSGGLAGATTALSVYQNGTGFYRMYVNDTASADSIVPNDLNKWNHFAVVRSGSTQKMYVNGIESLSASSTIDYTTARYLCIGGYYSTSYLWDGYIQDFRIYKGVAKYTSNFVVSSPSPDILPDTPSGVSGSSKLTKITDGAVSFDGATDSLSVADHADFTFGSGDFTMEAFVYNRSSSYRSIVMKYGGSPASSSWFWSMYNGQNQFYYYSGGNEPAVTSGKTHYNKWVHCAVSREGNTIRIFDDGELTGTLDVSSYATMNDSTVPLDIGADYANNYDMDGFISNVRIVKGTALYTSRFTPPAAPLTNVTNTKLLCCQSNTSNTQAAVIPNLTNFPAPYSAAARFGSYKEYTTVNKNVTSATTLPMSNPTHYQGNALDLASGGFQITTVNSAAEDFFMGMWVHFDTYETSKQFGVDIANNYVYFETQSSGAVKIRHTGDGGSTSAATSLDDGNWHHIALSRTGDTLYGFVDGTAVVNDSGGLSGNNSVAANSKFNFWGADNNFTSYNIDGQIIDAFIYIGKGVSSYTTPTAPLVGSDGTINHYSGFTDSDAYFISPCIDVTGSDANSITGSFTDIAGADTGSATNFNPFNTDINTVRGQETGYATLNPLRYSGYTTSNRIFTDGNLRMLGRGDGVSNFGVTTGKFYAEVFVERIKSGESGQGYIGVIAEPETYAERGWPTSKIAALRDSGGGASNNFYGDGKGTTTTTWTEGDTISVAFDADAAKVWIAKNGQYINGGNPATGVTPSFSGLTFKDYYFLVSDNKPSSSETTDGNRYQINFGQKPFKFSPPDGFQPLNLANTRPETVIARPDKYVGITTWKGDDQASHVINDLNFDGVPDFVWIKRRDGNSVSHQLYDTIRGATKPLVSSSTAVEDTQTSGLKAFVRNGFELGASSVVNGLDGDNGNVPFNYVAWCWKAGGSKGTFNIDDVSYASAAAAGLDGGLTVTGASVGTKQGFSIIKATGSDSQNSFKHGLGKVPKFVIAKDMDNSRAWYIYHGSLGANYRGSFDGAQFTSDSEYFGSGMTDTLVTLKSGGSGGNNYNGANMIYYVWADVPGLQKFGTYSGNSNADGPFIELGFRPALFVMKQTDSTGYWMVYDSARDPINNGSPYYLFWNDNSAHGTGYDLDFLSNGVKLRTDNANFNTTSYVYMAWAEAPTIDLYGGGASAR